MQLMQTILKVFWNTALNHAIQLMRDYREDQCIPKREDMKATL